MLQINIIPGEGLTDLKDKINSFLATIKSDAVRHIEIDIEHITAIIQYEISEAWKNELCCDCSYWDDGGAPDAVNGLCHEKGGRKRFNCRACEAFKDLRGQA